MPPQTRARYLAVEVAARHTEPAAAVRRDAQKRWTRWTRAQKAECIDNLDRIEHCFHRRDERIDAPQIEMARQRVHLRRGLDQQAQDSLHDYTTAFIRLQRAEWALGAALLTALRFYQRQDCPQALIDSAQADVDRQARRVHIGRGIIAFRKRLRQLEVQVQHPRRDHFKVEPRDGREACIQMAQKLVDRNSWQDDFSAESLIPHVPDAVEVQGPMLIYTTHDVIVTAWRFIDSDGDVVKSLVRKDASFYQHWSDMFMWLPNGYDVANRQFAEHYMHDRMYAAQTHPNPRRSNVLPVVRSGVDSLLKCSIQWTELATYGTLGDLLYAYENRAHLPGPAARVPEPFIWYVALTLVEVGLVMERGTLDANAPMPRGWQQIIHQDIKPQNIFLGPPTEERFPGYPQPMLGDFGQAITTYPEDPRNPEAFDELDTTYWAAPEQVAWHDLHFRPYQRHPLSSKTDVHNVGLIVQYMMSLHDLAYSDQDDVRSTPEYRAAIPDSSLTYYTLQLQALRHRCLRISPDDRASFRELHDMITDVLNGHPEDTRELQIIAGAYTGRVSVGRGSGREVFEYNPRWTERERESLLPWHEGDQRFVDGANGDIPGTALGERGLHEMENQHENQPVVRIGYLPAWTEPEPSSEGGQSPMAPQPQPRVDQSAP